MKRVFIGFVVCFLFLNCNKIRKRQILIIASQNDTILNPSFFDFLNTKNIGAYFIRSTTQEEDKVSKYKKNDEFYSYKNIKWTQKRITLPNL